MPILPLKAALEENVNSFTWKNLIEHIRRAVRGLAFVSPAVTSSSTVNESQYFVVVDTTSGNVTMTLPLAAKYKDKHFVFKKKVAANSLTVSCSGSDTIEGSASVVLKDQYAKLHVISDGNTTWYRFDPIDYKPRCRVHMNSTDFTPGVMTQSILPFTHEDWDVGGYWDTTNYKYTPLRAGYYRCTLAVLWVNAAGLDTNDPLLTRIRKNTVASDRGFDYAFTGETDLQRITTDTIYCNGSTDYIDFSIEYSASAGTVTIEGDKWYTYATIDYIGE